jgi:glycosyltransferase involved in cell wall biosynthesis
MSKILLNIRSLFGKAKLVAEAAVRALFYYGSIKTVLAKTWRIMRTEGAEGLLSRGEALVQTSLGKYHGKDRNSRGWLYGPFPQSSINVFTPKVSIIVPNYNHEKYLRKRLNSIYDQNYKNIEVLLLDDCSSDGSKAILKEYAERYPEITTLHFNSNNSGGVFNQWAKGLSLATGELIWIAESDDYCTNDFLEKLIDYFRNEAVMLAFCRTEFVKDLSGEVVWTLEDFLADTTLDVQRNPFIKSAHWLVNNAWGIKNIIPNVSGAVFRRPGAMKLLNDARWRSLRLCGDWVFYLNLIRGGLVAYSPLAVNYYRQHSQGTSLNTQKEDDYYREYEFVATTIQELYRVEPSILERQRETLYLHWCMSRGSSSNDEFLSLYDLNRARMAASTRKPNILMVGFALIAGGGETFPIMLTNIMRQKGFAITFLNCKVSETELGVRAMLHKDIPLMELNSLSLVADLCEDMGIEIVHSHHAWVDMMLVRCLDSVRGVRHVITMHGMYEAMPRDQIEGLLPIMDAKIYRVVYTAEKNLIPFSAEFRARKNFTRIENALERTAVTPVSRSHLGLDVGDFVFCLVSRAIPEKGWVEAINAIASAQKKCSRNLRLILIGEGPEYERLKGEGYNFVHFLGYKSNIRDYFAMADMGLLPSRFPGESFPLVVIDCLLSGKPVLASRIGEIPNMLISADGLAGEVFDLVNLSIPVESLSHLIIRLAEDQEYYQSLVDRVPAAAKKFDPSIMAEKYCDVYLDMLQ